MPVLEENCGSGRCSLKEHDVSHTTIVERPTKAQTDAIHRVGKAIRYYLADKCPQLPKETIVNATMDELMSERKGVLREARKANVTNALGGCAWMLTDAGFGISCATIIHTNDSSQIIPILPKGQPGHFHPGWRAPGRGGVGLHMDGITGSIAELLQDLEKGWDTINSKYNTQYVCHLVSPTDNQTTHFPYKRSYKGGSGNRNYYSPLTLKELSTLLQYFFHGDLGSYPELRKAWTPTTTKRKRDELEEDHQQEDDEEFAAQSRRTKVLDTLDGKVDLPAKLISTNVLNEFETKVPNGFAVEFRAPPVPKDLTTQQQEERTISVTTAFLAFVPHRGGPSKKNDCSRVSFFQVSPHKNDDERAMNPTFHSDYQYLIHDVLLPILDASSSSSSSSENNSNSNNNARVARERIQKWEDQLDNLNAGTAAAAAAVVAKDDGPQLLPERPSSTTPPDKLKRLKKLVYADGTVHHQFTKRLLALVKSQPTIKEMRMVVTGRYDDDDDDLVSNKKD